MSSMRTKTALAALAIVTMTGGLLTMTGPASADDRSDWRPHRHYYHHRWDRTYYPRDYVYVAPGYTYAPAPRYYYTPPSPGFSLNFNID